MMLERVVIIGLLLVHALGHNVEIRQIYPLYMRNGNSSANYSASDEPAYSGYSFDATMDGVNISILVGQPLTGVAGNTSSAGAIYYCNAKFHLEIESYELTTTYLPPEGSPSVSTVEDKTQSISQMTREEAVKSTVHDVATTTFGAKTVPVPSAATPSTFRKEHLASSCTKLTVFDRTSGYDHKNDTDALGLNMKKIGKTDDYTVCTFLRRKECTDADNTVTSLSRPGACYYGNPALDDWKFMKWSESKCYDSYIDIIFVVDGSKSISSSNFKLMKTWLIDVISELIWKYGDNIRTEVLQYSNKDFSGTSIGKVTKFKIPYTLNEALTIRQIQDKISNMGHLRGQTYTKYALKRVMEWEFEQSIYKKESKKVVVVLTDGAADDGIELSGWYRTYGASGKVIPFAVGVGSYNKGQLRVIANGNSPSGNDERVLTVATFSQLQSLLSTLTSSIASAVALEGQSGGLSSDQDAANSTNDRQMGASVTSLQDGSVHIGALGMYLDSGSIMQFDTLSDATPLVQPYSVIASALPKHTTDSYLGYTTVSGYFNGNNSGEYIAAGAPRYKLKGAVVVYQPDKNNATMKNRVTITPPKDARDQIAAYFGGCLLSVDVSGDGYDDLFIASPLFVGENYDEGRVSVYIGKSDSSTTEWANPTFLPIELSGDKSPGARFGSAIVGAGDINLDGYQDVVVGAPLADGERGVVFIYHGMSGGINQQPSQKILSSSLSGPSMKYFGQSLQGNIDVDGNSYPDIIVGAPKSDSLVFLKSRPIVKIYSTIEFTNPKISIFSCIDSNYINCATLKVCFYANGTSIEKTIGMVYNLTLDYAVMNERVVFSASTSSTMSQSYMLATHNQSCFEHNVNLKRTALDFYTLVEAKVDFDLTTAHTSVPMSSVFDLKLTKSNSATIGWTKDCEQNVCVPNLGVFGELILPPFISNNTDVSDEFMGILVVSETTAGKPMKVKINFTNTGENSFNTTLKITYPSKLTLTPVTTTSSLPSLIEYEEENIRSSTSTGVKKTERVFKYNSITNTMRPNSWVFFEMTGVFANLREDASLDSLNIIVTITSNSTSSKENDTTNNIWMKTIPIRYQSDISLRNEKGDAEIAFNHSENPFNITSVREIGENTSDVEVDLRITSGGYSSIPYSEITFTYPWLTKKNKPLLYLYKLECSTRTGKVMCVCDTSKVNMYNLSIDGLAANQTSSDFSNFQITPATTAIRDADMVCPPTATDKNHVCETFKCSVTNLHKDSELNFKANFRLWTASFNFENTNLTSIKMRSNFQISTQNSPLYISNDLKNVTVKENEITITAKKFVPVEEVEQQNDLLIYILATAGAFVLLCIIVLILWKVGFFKKSQYGQRLENEKEQIDEAEPNHEALTPKDNGSPEKE